MRQGYTDFPSQKKSSSEKKSKKWQRACVDAAESLALWRNEALRKSWKNKRINFNLYSDILDQSDVERICNPQGILGLSSPAKMQNYPIANPKIDLLVGESIKRKFDYKAVLLNNEAISEKEQELKKIFIKQMIEDIQSKAIDEKDLEERLKKFQQFRTFEYQDLREKRATLILRDLANKLRLDYKFAKGIKNAFISSEEIYDIDIIGGEPVCNVVNPLNIYTVRSGESPYFEDADIILILSYDSPGKIIDDYTQELTDSEIKTIESGFTSVEANSSINIGYKPDLAIKFDQAVDLAILENDIEHGSPFDGNGNIRKIHVRWKSLRKMKKVYYFDDEGDEQCELYDEGYTIDESKGEREEIIWVNEWWEGTKIGGGIGNSNDEGIYVKIQPRPVQFRKMENPSLCHPGIVGTIYNTNDNEGVSLMDRMKPYQYLYDILAYNTELMISKNKGKIMALDLANIPEGWKIDQWLSFAFGMNIAVKDSFKEGNKGSATGTLAGSLTSNQSQTVMDMEMGNSIQLYMNMMAYIKAEMGEIAGVSQARQGQIATSEAVGNVQREVTQSSHITEYWFMEHDFVKVRVLETLLETAKAAWKNSKNKRRQFVLDDGSMEMFEMDMDEFCETEFGLAISNSQASFELLQNLKELAHAGVQNGLINFSQLMDIYTTDSLSSIRRKLQVYEEDAKQEKMKADQMANETKMKELEHLASENEKTRDFTREEWDREDARNTENNNTKIIIANSGNKVDNNDDGLPDAGTLESLKLQAKKIDADIRLKEKQLAETQRHNKEKEKIDLKKANKPTASNK